MVDETAAARRTATVLLASVALVVPWAAGPAQAALLERHLVGVDVSYPQCGRPLPTGQAFAIVGVNGGSAATTNPCLPTLLEWAEQSTGGTVHDGQLYVNTGTLPAETCGPGGKPLHMRRRLQLEGVRLVRVGPGARRRAGAFESEQYMWWLDVEIANTWDYTEGAATGTPPSSRG